MNRNPKNTVLKKKEKDERKRVSNRERKWENRRDGNRQTQGKTEVLKCSYITRV